MGKHLRLPNHLIIAANLALAGPSGKRSWECFFPHECLYLAVRHAVDIASSRLHPRPSCETPALPREETATNEKAPNEPAGPDVDPLAHKLYAAGVIMVFIGTCLIPGHVWDKLLSANALLCWLLRSLNREGKRSRSIHASTRKQRCVAECVTAFISHAAVFGMTAPFDSRDAVCWLQLVGSHIPLAAITVPASGSAPEVQRLPWFEASCYLMQCLLSAVWLGSFSAIANLHLVEDREDIAFAGLDRTQVAAVFTQGWAFLASVVRRSHAAEGGMWARRVGAGVYAGGALGYYCYLGPVVENL